MNENQCANDVTEPIENALGMDLETTLRKTKKRASSQVRSSLVLRSYSFVQCHDYHNLIALEIYMTF